jgi:Ca2+:H+ antiporter
MTDSIQGLTEKAGVPRDFIGMVLLPILSNDAVAVQCASKDQMDLAIHSSLGKSIQTALVVAPVLVLVGWMIGIDDMNLLFDGFQVSALFLSVLLAQHCILDGKSNW